MIAANPASFGEEVRRLREARKLTPTRLGQYLASSSSAIHQIETGQRYPRRTVLLQLAEALNCDAARLMDLCQISKAAAEEEKRDRRAQEGQSTDEAPPSNPRLLLAWRIETARRKMGLSQAETERRCGMSKGQMRAIERAEIFPQGSLPDLSTCLGIGLTELIQLCEVSRAANTARLLDARAKRSRCVASAKKGANP